MAEKIDEPRAGFGTPRDFPTTTPTETVSREYSFSLQAVMELQKAVGQLSERMDSVRKQIENQGEKLDSISHQIYAAWAVLVVLLTVGGFIIDKSWSLIMAVLALALKAPK